MDNGYQCLKSSRCQKAGKRPPMSTSNYRQNAPKLRFSEFAEKFMDKRGIEHPTPNCLVVKHLKSTVWISDSAIFPKIWIKYRYTMIYQTMPTRVFLRIWLMHLFCPNARKKMSRPWRCHTAPCSRFDRIPASRAEMAEIAGWTHIWPYLTRVSNWATKKGPLVGCVI